MWKEGERGRGRQTDRHAGMQTNRQRSCVCFVWVFCCCCCFDCVIVRWICFILIGDSIGMNLFIRHGTPQMKSRQCDQVRGLGSGSEEVAKTLDTEMHI